MHTGRMVGSVAHRGGPQFLLHWGNGLCLVV